VSYVTQCRRHGKRGFGSGDVDGLGQSVDARNATNKMCVIGARRLHKLPWLCRFLAGLSPVQLNQSVRRHGLPVEKGGGQLDAL
jgi:hypothetical protein